jgi:hypothetical protein
MLHLSLTRLITRLAERIKDSFPVVVHLVGGGVVFGPVHLDFDTYDYNLIYVVRFVFRTKPRKQDPTH